MQCSAKISIIVWDKCPRSSKYCANVRYKQATTGENIR